jgi:agmatine deiminase
MNTLLAEWAPQWGVMIAWPSELTDWADLLEEAEQTYCALAKAILAQEGLLVICRNDAHQRHIQTVLGETGTHTRLQFRHLDYNDTWARDFGPLTVRSGNGGNDGNAKNSLLDFGFNGWGSKFAAEKDNAVSRQIDWQCALRSLDVVLEGGSVESNGNGLLLTTSHCLLNPNRNPTLDQTAVEALLMAEFGAEHILWLHSGHLEGDDTDAHIDTLARFCDETTIAYVQCSDPDDSHYPALTAMEAELQVHARQHQLQLLPLPMAEPAYDEDGQRLPATYANFLIINNAVLMPTYSTSDTPTSTDKAALAQLGKAFPQHQIIGVPCLPLVHQHGSLHCVTMQLPEGVL